MKVGFSRKLKVVSKFGLYSFPIFHSVKESDRRRVIFRKFFNFPNQTLLSSIRYQTHTVGYGVLIPKILQVRKSEYFTQSENNVRNRTAHTHKIGIYHRCVFTIGHTTCQERNTNPFIRASVKKLVYTYKIRMRLR